MKNLNSLLFLGVMGLFIACSGSKSTPYATTPNSPTSTPTAQTSRTVDGSTRQTSANPRVPNPEKPTTTVNNRNIKTDREARMKQMYSSLNMTEDQINRYESAYRQNQNTWEERNDGREMSAEERNDWRNNTFRSILDPTQYQDYQNWSKSNPDMDY